MSAKIIARRDGYLIRLFRACWTKGRVGDGSGYSCKLTLALYPKIAGWSTGFNEWTIYFLGLRIHFMKSYGGIFAPLLIACCLANTSRACDSVLLQNAYGCNQQATVQQQVYAQPQVLLQNVAYQAYQPQVLLQRQYVQQQVLRQNVAYQRQAIVLQQNVKHGGGPLLIRDRSRQRGQVVTVRDERRGIGRLLLGR